MRALTRTLILAASVGFASSCANSVESVPIFPNAVDLTVQPEPPLPIEALSDPAVEDQWRDETLLWGRAGWQAVGRLCRFFEGHGMVVICPE